VPPLHLLEDAAAEHVGVGLPAHHQDGYRVHEGGRQAHGRVYRPGANGCKDRQRLPLHAVVPVGQVNGALLVPDLYRVDTLLPSLQGVYQPQAAVSRDASEVGDSPPYQVLEDELTARKPHSDPRGVTYTRLRPFYSSR